MATHHTAPLVFPFLRRIPNPVCLLAARLSRMPWHVPSVDQAGRAPSRVVAITQRARGVPRTGTAENTKRHFGPPAAHQHSVDLGVPGRPRPPSYARIRAGTPPGPGPGVGSLPCSGLARKGFWAVFCSLLGGSGRHCRVRVCAPRALPTAALHPPVRSQTASTHPTPNGCSGAAHVHT